jgi:hypothetical protein
MNIKTDYSGKTFEELPDTLKQILLSLVREKGLPKEATHFDIYDPDPYFAFMTKMDGGFGITSSGFNREVYAYLGDVECEDFVAIPTDFRELYEEYTCNQLAFMYLKGK